MNNPKARRLCLALLALCLPNHHTSAAGVVTAATESNLRSALVGGGNVTFGASGTIALTSTLVITNDTVLDARGQSVALNGGDSVRLLFVPLNVTLTLKNLTLTHGRAMGTNGAAGADGGEGQGGAVMVEGGTLILEGCRMWTNSVAGGAGGNANYIPPNHVTNGGGGGASGGAIRVSGGTLLATNSDFVGNSATGGAGGTNTLGPLSGVGGSARGGALGLENASLTLVNCGFHQNQAKGGLGPYQTSIANGNSGDAQGAALFFSGSTSAVQNCAFTLNEASSARPIGPIAGYGGQVSGGAIHHAMGNMQIAGSQFSTNRCVGGDGLRYYTPGTGNGGAIFNRAEMTVGGCAFIGNEANGGSNGNGGDGKGGAVFNGASLQITDTLMTGNTAKGGSSYKGGQGGLPQEGTAFGGAIFNTSNLVVLHSTFQNNLAQGVNGGINISVIAPSSGCGGALANFGSFVSTNATFAGNVARGGDALNTNYPGGSAYGGAIFNQAGLATLVNVTVANSGAQRGNGLANVTSFGGGIFSTNATTLLLNTILANSTSGSNSSGAIVDLGHNLSSDLSGSFSAPGSMDNVDPKLGPLADYGGLTPTVPLLTGSPAIDAGNDIAAPATDQRGRFRPYGVASDIGAFESSAPFVIRGRISGMKVQPGIPISAGANNTVTVNEGHYSFEDLTPAGYTVIPLQADYLMVPSDRSITVGPDQVDVSFKAYQWNALSLESSSNGVLHLVYAGTNGNTVRLLASSDLVNWMAISTNTVSTSNYFDIFENTGAPRFFYRTVTP